jgi:hypothetical protein
VDGVCQRQKRMTAVPCQVFQRLFRKIQVQESITNNSSRLGWKWWKVYCNKRQCWKIKTEGSVIIRNWYKNCLPKLRVNMLARRKDTLLKKSTWLAESNRELIKTYSRIVISDKSKSKIIFNFSVQLTPKLSRTIL